MKKILALLVAFAFIFSCTEDRSDYYYKGDTLLEFNQGENVEAFVPLNEGNANYQVSYGVTAPVSGSHTVKLVFDQSKSTAILGTDFTIVEDTDVLEDGQTVGNFLINVTETAAADGNKYAVFTLENSSLPKASFNQEQKVYFKLNCPIDDTFPLSYLVDVQVPQLGFFAPSYQTTMTKVDGTDNQFRLTSAWGPDFVAAATGDPSYSGQYLYSGVLTINCTEVTFVGDEGYATGGSGTYDPISGVIVLNLSQGLFSGTWTVQSTFFPL